MTTAPAASLAAAAALLVSACASGGCEHEWIVRSRCEVQHKPMPTPTPAAPFHNPEVLTP